MSITSTNVATPPAQHTWIDTYQRLFPSWKSLALSHQSSIPLSISRVNQFDAARLDIEMSAMLKEQLVKVFSLMKVLYCVIESIVVVGFAKKIRPLHFLPALANTGTVITALGRVVLQLHHFGVPDAASKYLQCSDMV